MGQCCEGSNGDRAISVSDVCSQTGIAIFVKLFREVVRDKLGRHVIEYFHLTGGFFSHNSLWSLQWACFRHHGWRFLLVTDFVGACNGHVPVITDGDHCQSDSFAKLWFWALAGSAGVGALLTRQVLALDVGGNGGAQMELRWRLSLQTLRGSGGRTNNPCEDGGSSCTRSSRTRQAQLRIRTSFRMWRVQPVPSKFLILQDVKSDIGVDMFFYRLVGDASTFLFGHLGEAMIPNARMSFVVGMAGWLFNIRRMW